MPILPAATASPGPSRTAAAGTVELASGAFPNGGKQDFAEGKTPQNLNAIPVKPGDRLQLLVLPKGDYSCDTTTVEFVITQKDGRRTSGT